MIKRLLLTSMLLGGLAASAQTWTMQTVGFISAGAYPFDISVPDANSAWCVAYDGSGAAANLQEFSRTIDGGATWTAGLVSTGTNLAFSCISAIDADTAYAMMYDADAGAGGGIFKTTDGGANWAQIAVGLIFDGNSFPNVVHFFDAQNGFAMGDPNGGYFEIYTTNDFGASWNRVPSGSIPAPLAGEYGIVNDFDVVGQTIWFGTNKGRVFKSDDGGLNWTAASVPASASRTISAIGFRDANTGICISTPTSGTATAYTSTDGGATWTLLSPAGPMFLSEVDNIPGTNVWVSCGASTVGRGSSYSTDDGASWVGIDTSGQGTMDGYTEVGFLDINTGYAGGFAVDQLTDGVYKWDAGILSAKDLSPRAEFVAYPNPSQGLVNLRIKARQQDVLVRLIDMTGREVAFRSFQQVSGLFNQTLDFSYLPAGLYNLVVENGSDRVTERIVLQ